MFSVFLVSFYIKWTLSRLLLTVLAQDLVQKVENEDRRKVPSHSYLVSTFYSSIQNRNLTNRFKFKTETINDTLESFS